MALMLTLNIYILNIYNAHCGTINERNYFYGYNVNLEYLFLNIYLTHIVTNGILIHD